MCNEFPANRFSYHLAAQYGRSQARPLALCPIPASVPAVQEVLHRLSEESDREAQQQGLLPLVATSGESCRFLSGPFYQLQACASAKQETVSLCPLARRPQSARN